MRPTANGAPFLVWGRMEAERKEISDAMVGMVDAMPSSVVWWRRSMVLGRSVVWRRRYRMRWESQSIVEGNGEGRCDDRWSMVDGRWSMVDGRWSMVNGGNGKEHRERTLRWLSCLLFVLVFYFIFCFIKHGGALFIFWYFFFFLVLFFFFF